MEIPIQNIYYLLCYSWNKLDERDIVNVDFTTFNNVLDLFSQVLINGCTHLFKKGLDRNYIETAESIKGVKGKIDFSSSLKQNLFSNAQSYCEFDELDYNVLHNQILKTTIYKLIKEPELDKRLREQLVVIYRKFDNVSIIKIKSRDFSRVMLYRNNYFYDFLLKICQIIYDTILITEEQGRYKFKNFIEDKERMRMVFEHFVRNFYKKEQKVYAVKSEIIKWDASPFEGGTLEKLPQMKTDISLLSDTRKIIIDTKYYLRALTYNYKKEKIRTQHLYQMFAYLKNTASKGGINSTCEGILLYPTVNQDLNEVYKIGSHKLSIRTVDLNQHWQQIHERLISILR